MQQNFAQENKANYWYLNNLSPHIIKIFMSIDGYEKITNIVCWTVKVVIDVQIGNVGGDAFNLSHMFSCCLSLVNP
jgi:hypothetical protein